MCRIFARKYKRLKISRVTLIFLLAFFTACTSDYSAPVSDKSEAVIINAPLIVTNSEIGLDYRSNQGPTNFISNVSAGKTYRVQSGDNLISIAFNFDLDFRALARANSLSPPYTIFVDQELTLDLNKTADIQSARNSGLGVEAPSNSVARSQGINNQPTNIVRQSIAIEDKKVIWEWPSTGEIINGFSPNGNKGIDIGGQVGDAVFAAAEGDVVYSGRDVQGIGNLLIVRHGERYLSAYAHNSKMLVFEGDQVKPGQKIAEIGMDLSGEPALHFEIRIDGKPTNPIGLLPGR